MSWLEESIDNYYKWLRDKTFMSKDNSSEWFTITTPFIGQFNDYIEIFAKKEGEKITLSDDGITLRNLELTGTNISRSPKRKELLNIILLNHGVFKYEEELQVTANASNFAQKKQNLINAIIEISDLEILSTSTVSSIFLEDITDFFNEQNILYTRQFIAKGATGLDFTFDFQITGARNELVIKSFNSLNKLNVPNFLFGLNDIKEARERITGKALKSLAIINDSNREIKSEYIDALVSKGTDYLLWSDKDKHLDKLRA